jgi:hypothetical protein
VGFPFGEEGGALGAEGVEFGGEALGFFCGGEMAEGLFARGYAGVDGSELGFDGGYAVFELLELDRVEALDWGERSFWLKGGSG